MKTYPATRFDSYDVLNEILKCTTIETYTDASSTVAHLVGGANGGYQATVYIIGDDVAVADGHFGANQNKAAPRWDGGYAAHIKSLVSKIFRKSPPVQSICTLGEIGFQYRNGIYIHTLGGFYVRGEYALRIEEVPAPLFVDEPGGEAPDPLVWDTGSGIYIDFGDAHGRRLIPNRREFWLLSGMYLPVTRQGDILFVPTEQAGEKWETEYDGHVPSQKNVCVIASDAIHAYWPDHVQRDHYPVYEAGTTFNHAQHPEVTLDCRCAAVILPGWTRPGYDGD